MYLHDVILQDDTRRSVLKYNKKKKREDCAGYNVLIIYQP